MRPWTDEVYAIPQLTIPPQINKMYINDLSPEKSVVKYQVDGGIQTFVISWRNPTKEQGSWGMADYVASCEEAMRAVGKITGSDKVNVSAGCSGGQTASVLASKLAAENSDLLGALTLMVCVLHPQHGDIEAGALMTDNGLELAKKRAAKGGIIKGDDLSRGFAWLRPNDLIWNYVINNYLLGDDPPAFDVLFWNSDATNLSATLMGDFLTLSETLAFTRRGEVEMAGHQVDLSKVEADLFILGGVTDHITPWRADVTVRPGCFGSDDVDLCAQPVRAHAGDPQSAGQSEGESTTCKKRNGALPATAEEWLQGTEEQAGSWWPFWLQWLQDRSGAKKAAPKKARRQKVFAATDPAPGAFYVPRTSLKEPAIATDPMSTADVRLMEVGGRTLRVATWRLDIPSEHLPVLFFNGIGANIEAVAPLAEALDDRGLRDVSTCPVSAARPNRACPTIRSRWAGPPPSCLTSSGSNRSM